MSEWSPNARYSHVFAIVRLDLFHGDELASKQNIKVVKVVRTEKTAEAEVRRLNELNADKGCTYFWQITRLEEPVVGT